MYLIKLDGDGGYLTLGPGMQLLVTQVVTAGENSQWQVRVRQETGRELPMAWVVSRHKTKQGAAIALASLVAGLPL